MFVLIGLHLLKQACQVLLADLQLGPLKREKKNSSETHHRGVSHLSPPFPNRGSQDLGIFVKTNHQNRHPQPSPDVTHMAGLISEMDYINRKKINQGLDLPDSREGTCNPSRRGH